MASQEAKSLAEKVQKTLHETYPDYDFQFLTEYQLYGQNIKAFEFIRNKKFSNIKRQNQGNILIYNNNPGDISWNVQDISKTAVTSLMKIENRINKNQGAVSQNLFHSSSFKTSQNTLFSSEHEDSLISKRNTMRDKKFRQENTQKNPKNAPSTEKMENEQLNEPNGNVGGSKRIAVKMDGKESIQDKKGKEKVEAFKDKYHRNELSLKEKTNSEEKKQFKGKKIIVREKKLATLDDKTFEDFLSAAREKGWIKK